MPAASASLNPKQWLFFYFSIAFSVTIYCLTPFYSRQSHFLSILFFFGSAFIIYLLFWKIILKYSGNVLLWLIPGLFFRIACSFTLADWSPDIYRYFWDGLMCSHGINPFQYTPTEFLQHAGNIDPLFAQVYAHLSSSEYFSIYPAPSQLLFFISASLGGKSILGFAMVLRLLYLSIELGLIYFLIQYFRTSNRNSAYIGLLFLNPLWIFESYANAHIELIMLVALLLAVVSINSDHFKNTGFFLFALSIASKLSSVIFVPAFFLKWIKAPHISGLNAFLVGAVMFLPLAATYPDHFLQSVSLFFRQFEFNSFLYKPIIYSFHNAQLYSVEKFTSLILMLVFIVIYLKKLVSLWNHQGDDSWYRSIFILAFCFYLLSSTVHPWYICMIVGLGIFSYYRTAVCWSGMVIVSYSHYDPHWINYQDLFTLIEYLVVLSVFIIENKKAMLIRHGFYRE